MCINFPLAVGFLLLIILVWPGMFSLISARLLPIPHTNLIYIYFLLAAIPLKPLPLEAETRTEESGCICWNPFDIIVLSKLDDARNQQEPTLLMAANTWFVCNRLILYQSNKNTSQNRQNTQALWTHLLLALGTGGLTTQHQPTNQPLYKALADIIIAFLVEHRHYQSMMTGVCVRLEEWTRPRPGHGLFALR